MTVRFCAATHPGTRRSENQDVVLADPELGLFIVADGMGGHARGDVAARLVVETIHQFFIETERDPHKTWPFGYDINLSFGANRLKVGLQLANRRVAAQRVGSDTTQLGATVTTACVEGNRVHVANVGDCRTYLWRAGEVRQITTDHSWVAEEVQAGRISEEFARAHPLRHIVTRAIHGNDLVIDVSAQEVLSGDRMLLCSDGLHGVLPDSQLLHVLSSLPIDDICSTLIRAANDRGAPDNVSAVVVEWSMSM